jgi:hypothetical protein
LKGGHVRGRGGEVQKTDATAIAVTNDVSVLDRFDCLDGGQTWVTWSHTHELDLAHAFIPTRDTLTG